MLFAASLILGALSARCADNSTVVGRALVSVAVSPAVDTLTRIGDTLILTVTVDGRQAGPLEPISWTSLSERVATVDSLGAVRAVAEGSALIVAAIGGQADTAVILVWPLRLTQLVLTPASITLAPGDTVQFAVSGTWSDGSSTVLAVTYAATGGTITAGGRYTAGTTPGTFQVIAVQQLIGIQPGGPKADSAVVMVSPAAPTGLAVVTQPGGAVSGITFGQQPVVEVRNGQNQPVAQAGILVAASKATGTGSLVGTLTATTNAQGRASFATLAIVGSGLHTLDFTAVGLTKGTSQGFDVSPPAGFAVNAGADQTIAFGGAAVMNATITGATPVNAFWTMISGPGKASLASEQFNSTFDDLTLTDWIGGHQQEQRFPDGAFPDQVGIQGDQGNWFTSDNAPPTTDRPRTGAHSWKAFTPYDSDHSAKLLKWNLDNTEAYSSVWVYWPSGQVVSGHGSGGFTGYLNLMQWKERASPWNPTWVIAVIGMGPGQDQFAIHDWYNSQPIVQTGVPVPLDQWFNLTAYMKEGFGTSGELKVWVNHTLIYHQSGINTLGAVTNTTAHLMWGIGVYSNALVGQGEQSVYFDDVTVTPAADVTKTTATFAAPGTYVLRLTAFDGTSTLSDDVTITVQ